MKHLIFFFLFIFFSSPVIAFSLQASPDEVFLFSFPNNEVCKEISIEASEESKITVNERWAEGGYNKKMLVDHKLPPEELSIKSSFNEEFKIQGRKNLRVCFLAKEKGFYHGVLLIKAEGHPVGVGVWVNFNVTKKSSLISGFSVKDSSSEDGGKWLLYGVLVFVIIILIEVLILIRKKSHH